VTRAYIGLGSNLGDRLANLEAAIEALDWGGSRAAVRSPVYETEPVGGPPDQPRYMNMVIGVDTDLDVRDLFERCQGVEAALGREREGAQRWGPRTIDIDILLFGDVVVDERDLVVPHPRMLQRGFVLVPLADIDPSARIPGYGSVAEARAALDGSLGVALVAR